MADKKKKEPIGNIIKNNFYMVKKIFQHSPMLVVLMLGQGIINGIRNSIGVVFTALVFDALGRGADFSEFIPIFLLEASAIIGAWLYGRINFLYLRPWMQNKLHYAMHNEIFKKSMEADLSCFDDPEFYNDFVWAMDESDTRAVNVLERFSQFINYIITLVTTFTIVFSVSIVIVIISLVRSVVVFFFQKYSNKLNLSYSTEIKPLNRKESYINRVFHLGEYAKELRTSRLSENLLKDYESTADKTLATNLRYNKKFFLVSSFYALSDFLPSAISISIVTVGLYNGTVDVAGFAIVMAYMWRVMSIFQQFGFQINAFEKNSLYIDKYIKFMSFKPKVISGDKKVPEFESLELKNVSFKYKDKDDCPFVLKNINLKIKKGQKIALVGYNGAGKTTLIKLFMRFYDPCEGEILYNGINIKEYDLKEFRGKIGAVFQDFKLFSATIAENVLGRPIKNDEDKKTVLKALSNSSFDDKLCSLPNGIDTMITREFDDEGQELSGGESQKVAIARVFAGNHDLVIMDEPSSALDPIAEYNLNHSVSENLKDKTVIFISHRLSTTRMTDMIYMFDKGEIVEKGCHNELIEFKGKYAEMFEIQAKTYKIE